MQHFLDELFTPLPDDQLSSLRNNKQRLENISASEHSQKYAETTNANSLGILEQPGFTNLKLFGFALYSRVDRDED